MSTDTTTAPDPKILDEVRLQGPDLLPGSHERIASLLSTDPNIRAARPEAMARAVAEHLERVAERFRDPDAPAPESKSPARRYLKALEAAGVVQDAERAFAEVATAVAPLAGPSQLEHIRRKLADRDFANKHATIAHKPGPSPMERRMRDLAGQHFADQPDEVRLRIGTYTDLARPGVSEAEAIRMAASRVGLGPEDGRRQATQLRDGSVAHGVGASATRKPAAWNTSGTLPSVRI
ncbi:hypothetical protein [Tautonia rosea]|uniref:hypothetical protein n=1 Tax=Tautonia rosea TaxID=2728037 RepID=UPI0014728D43|nr:hypothetical protein [Tautonia rosea]